MPDDQIRDLEGRIAQLEGDLSYALWTVLERTQSEFTGTLFSIVDEALDVESARGARRRAAHVIAERQAGAERVPCPLCNMAFPTSQGFTSTEGLVAHLLGSDGARQCDVFRAADVLAAAKLHDRI